MFSGSKAPKTCSGCEARADEIAQLRAQNVRLLNQVLTLAGKPEAIVGPETLAVGPGNGKHCCGTECRVSGGCRCDCSPCEIARDEEAPEPPPDPYHEAAAHLSDHAAARGLKVVDFADA